MKTTRTRRRTVKGSFKASATAVAWKDTKKQIVGIIIIVENENENKNTIKDKANIVDDNEEILLMATDECDEECVCKKNCQFNKKGKETLQIEDVALGCWVCDDVLDEINERNNENEEEAETFDPNEQQEADNENIDNENEAVNGQDIVPNDMKPLEFRSGICGKLFLFSSSQNPQTKIK